MANSNLVLVTGGAGFIGSHLVRHLLQGGFGVRVLDDFSTGKTENLADVASQIEIIEGTMVDAATMAKAVEGVDCILHQAAIPSVPLSVREPMLTNETMVSGTLMLLMAAREAGVRRVLYAASTAAYGDSPTMPKVESMPTNPLSPYAVAKLAGEHYCRAFYRVYGQETICLRYFNIFGPRQDPKSEYAAVIPRFITAMLQEQPVTIYGDGEQSRDFTYIDNAVQANLKAMTAAPDALGETCNVACGERFTLNQVAAMLGEIIGVEPKIDYLEGRQGDVKHSLASIDKARQLLGYDPQVSFRQGLEKTVDYFKALA